MRDWNPRRPVPGGERSSLQRGPGWLERSRPRIASSKAWHSGLADATASDAEVLASGAQAVQCARESVASAVDATHCRAESSLSTTDFTLWMADSTPSVTGATHWMVESTHCVSDSPHWMADCTHWVVESTHSAGQKTLSESRKALAIPCLTGSWMPAFAEGDRRAGRIPFQTTTTTNSTWQRYRSLGAGLTCRASLCAGTAPA